MKIRTKLTLRYLIVSTLLIGAVFFILEETLFPEAGYDMLHILNFKLITIWIITLAVLFAIGWFMAGSALRPVSHIIRQVESITASRLNRRVDTGNGKDEISELAMTFNKTLDRLEESFEAQKLFISNISHELRTPIAALIAEIELSIRKDHTAGEYREILCNVLGDARKIAHLSGGLLDLARASYDTERIAMSTVYIDGLLLDASATVMKANPGYNVIIGFDDIYIDEKMTAARGNSYLLQTAFVNLIENGCKFSPDRTCTIRLSVSDDSISASFSDNGIGIPPEDMDSLFKPFYRGRNKFYSAGNGIGLALVERIATLHGGTISAVSDRNSGSRFTFTIRHL